MPEGIGSISGRVIYAFGSITLYAICYPRKNLDYDFFLSTTSIGRTFRRYMTMFWNFQDLEYIAHKYKNQALWVLIVPSPPIFNPATDKLVLSVPTAAKFLRGAFATGCPLALIQTICYVENFSRDICWPKICAQTKPAAFKAALRREWPTSHQNRIGCYMLSSLRRQPGASTHAPYLWRPIPLTLRLNTSSGLAQLTDSCIDSLNFTKENLIHKNLKLRRCVPSKALDEISSGVRQHIYNGLLLRNHGSLIDAKVSTPAISAARIKQDEGQLRE